MKKKTIKLFIFTILFLSFSSSVQALTGTIINTDGGKDPIPLRASIAGTEITKLPWGSTVEVINTSAGTSGNCTKQWYKVKQGINEGYTCGDFIKLNNSEEEGTVKCIEDTSPLNIWSTTTKSSKLTSLNCNAKLTVLEKNVASNSSCSNWYKVRSGSYTGYSCGKYIETSSTPSGSTPSYSYKESAGDNIYQRDNYKDKPTSDGTISCYEDTTNASLKSSVGGSKVEEISCGTPVKINSTKDGSGTCPYYYNVTNLETNKSGYICGYFVNTTKLSSTAEEYYKTKESKEEYQNKLKNIFPDSYIPYLLEIHARYPKWKFNPRNINLDFDKVVSNESYYGRNLVDGRNNGSGVRYFDINYMSMDINTYNILEDKFYEYPTEGGWYNASSEAIAYYLDPRNYLNVKYIFAFEPLIYNSSFTATNVSSILNQGFWSTVYNGNNVVGTDVIKASEEADISAIHIASRIRQEINSISASDPRLGGTFKYNGTEYSGYYNFYNIAVYGQDKITNGMVYAMNNGWNTPYNGILGGAKFIRTGYIGVKQDNIYFEKFDVQNSNPDYMYTHQYQQNLSVGMGETNTAYGRYITFDNYLNTEITFDIPVYKNMPNYAVTSPRVGNPNNYLKDIKINNTTVSGFSYDTYNYDINVSSDTKNINVEAIKINSAATVTGTGTINIDSNNKTVEIKVTAENKRTRTYKLNIKRAETPKPDDKDEETPVQDPTVEVTPITTIMNSSGVKYNNTNIFGIGEKVDSSSLINNVKKTGELNTASIKDKNGNPKTGIFKTGDKVIISNSKDTTTYTVVIYGDIDGNGLINKDDCLEILRQMKGYTNLSGAFKDAADIDKNGQINKDDCLEILRYLKGYTNFNK